MEGPALLEALVKTLAFLTALLLVLLQFFFQSLLFWRLAFSKTKDFCVFFSLLFLAILLIFLVLNTAKLDLSKHFSS